MSDYLRNPIEFILTVIFQLYITAVMLRFLLQWVRADFYNPLSQAIVQLTNPALRPLRRLIPGLGGLDLAALLLVFAIECVLVFLVGAYNLPYYQAFGFIAGNLLSPQLIAALAFAELVALTFNIFIFALIIQAILSWVSPGHNNPASALLYKLTGPLLRPARHIIPPVSGLDLSLLVVVVLLQVAKMLVMPLFGLILR